MAVVPSYTRLQIQEITANGDIIKKGKIAEVIGGIVDGENAVVKIFKHQEFYEVEKEFLYGFKHPNINMLLGYAKEENFWALVLQRKPTTLANVHQGMKWPRIIKTLREVAVALRAVHQWKNKDAVYCILDPNHILLDDEGKVELSNFTGIAGKIVCPIFTAPEIKRWWDSIPSQKSDSYSFGILILILITKTTIEELEGAVDAFVRKIKTHWKQLGLHAVNKTLMAKQKIKGQEKLNYKRISGQQDPDELEGCTEDQANKITQLALNCLNEIVESRPSIQDLIQSLR